MRLRHVSMILAFAVVFAGCGGSTSIPAGPTAVAPTPSSPTGTGTSAATGSTTCAGPFDHGQMTMAKR
jgi:PBP1b-binding outer membrane lipoprotein LpoB